MYSIENESPARVNDLFVEVDGPRRYEYTTECSSVKQVENTHSEPMAVL